VLRPITRLFVLLGLLRIPDVPLPPVGQEATEPAWQGGPIGGPRGPSRGL